MRRSSQRNGRIGTVRRRAGTLLALLALLGQMVVALLPMPVMAGDGTPICALDGQATPKSDPHQGSHLPDCPFCQAAQLLGSLAPPDPVGVPVIFRRVERVALPVVAGAQTQRAVFHRQARAPPVEI